MNKHTLKAEPRAITGRKVKTLRNKGLVPSNVFGKKIESQAIQVEEKEFKEVYKEAGETGLIELIIGSEKKPVLVHGIQLNPKTDGLLHVDFLQVDLKEKVEAQVPVEFVGESPAEKQSLGTVVLYINEVTVEALPADFPEKFEVDKSVLVDVDQAIYIKDLKVDSSKVEIKADAEEIVAKVDAPQKIEEVVAPASEGENDTATQPSTESSGSDSTSETPKE